MSERRAKDPAYHSERERISQRTLPPPTSRQYLQKPAPASQFLPFASSLPPIFDPFSSSKLVNTVCLHYCQAIADISFLMTVVLKNFWVEIPKKRKFFINKSNSIWPDFLIIQSS